VLTPADRRKKGNRIIVGQAGVPRSKLFVAGSDEGATKCRQLGEARCIAIEKTGQRGALGHFQGVCAEAREFTDASEEQDADAKIA